MRSIMVCCVAATLPITALSAAGAWADDAGLLAHWKLDDRDGDVAKDSSGAGRHATIFGGTVTRGVLGGAIAFDGQDDFIELGDLGEFECATLAFWFKADRLAGPGPWQGLVSSDAWEEGVFHVPLGRGFVDVHLHMGESRRGRLTSSKLKPGAWYHVAVAADTRGGEIRLFTNGYEDDVDDVTPLAGGIKLIGQVVGREGDGTKPARYFQGAVDDVRIYARALDAAEIKALCPDAPQLTTRDPRDIRTGRRIPDEGYCDQPYAVITADGNWLLTMTTGPGREGQHGQHVVALVSSDHGVTWSDPIDIEPSDGPEASWAMPLVTPGGRVYAFYTYNGENLRIWE
ncbi:MAG: LamG domain-containing protein, partial [Planctomycetota bacterium]